YCSSWLDTKKKSPHNSWYKRLSSKLAASVLALAVFVVLGACASDEGPSPTATLPSASDDDLVLADLEISPQDSAIDEGDTRQFTAIGVLPDDTRFDVTSRATWNSSDESIAAIDQRGLARAIASGSADITAVVDGITSDALTLEVFVPFATEDGVTLRGRRFGEGDAFVILAHMFPAEQTSWYPFASELAGNGYAAFTFDFRGYGASDGERVISDIDKDLEAALDLARSGGAKQVFLIGASMGGTASLKVAAREPVAGVVTISAPVQFMSLDVEEDVSLVDEPKLFVATEDDRSAAINASNLFESAQGTKEIKIFSGSAHGTDVFGSQVGTELEVLLLEFLSTYSMNGSVAE
ncbi:MAG: alpha/beta fold hydrolase, partial [Dehalococcoidia bacterium]